MVVAVTARAAAARAVATAEAVTAAVAGMAEKVVVVRWAQVEPSLNLQ